MQTLISKTINSPDLPKKIVQLTDDSENASKAEEKLSRNTVQGNIRKIFITRNLRNSKT